MSKVYKKYIIVQKKKRKEIYNSPEKVDTVEIWNEGIFMSNVELEFGLQRSERIKKPWKRVLDFWFWQNKYSYDVILLTFLGLLENHYNYGNTKNYLTFLSEGC